MRRHWVKCKEELPMMHEDVLMLFDNGSEANMAVGFIGNIVDGVPSWCAYTDGGWYADCENAPDYWMLPPVMPKGVGK